MPARSGPFGIQHRRDLPEGDSPGGPQFLDDRSQIRSAAPGLGRLPEQGGLGSVRPLERLAGSCAEYYPLRANSAEEQTIQPLVSSEHGQG
jgi:hypothetical protein